MTHWCIWSSGRPRRNWWRSPAGSRTAPVDRTQVRSGTTELPTVDDTIALGEQLGRQLRAGDVVVLSGPLGAGKTALTKGIALGMDVEGPVTSPTYVLARVHRARRAGQPELVHVD